MIKATFQRGKRFFFEREDAVLRERFPDALDMRDFFGFACLGAAFLFWPRVDLI